MRLLAVFNVLQCERCGATALLSEYHSFQVFGMGTGYITAYRLTDILDCGCGSTDWRFRPEIDFLNMPMEIRVERFDFILSENPLALAVGTL